jgi:hypothetical protein
MTNTPSNPAVSFCRLSRRLMIGATSGEGWAAPWTLLSNSGAVIAKNITSATPLNKGGNYLENKLTIAPVASAPIKGGGSSRQLDPASVKLDKPFTVSFAFRGEGSAGKMGPFRIFQTNRAKTGTGSTDTWSLYPKTNGFWHVTDGNRDGTAREKRLIAYTPGETYVFTVSVDPESQSYSVTVTASSGATATLKQLGFRTAELKAGEYLNFMASGIADTAAPTDYTFAIDSITVSSPAR